MRKALIPIFLVFASLVGATASADAATYRGGGEDIKVEFRVRGQKIVYARISAVLYCTSPERGAYRKRMLSYYGTKRFPNSATAVHLLPVPVHQDGRFRSKLQVLGDGGSEEELLSGRVRSGSVSGRFLSLSLYDAECRTGGYQRLGNRNLAEATLRFRARRQ